MTGNTTSALMASNEGSVAHITHANGSASLVLVCEHASSFIPACLDELGLAEDARYSHIAWDIGAYDLALALSRLLDAPLVASDVSRLVYDCNRPLADASATPSTSEIYSVPGNNALSAEQRQERYNEVYLPFESLVSQQIGLQSEKLAANNLKHPWQLPLLVTVHSFTPVYHGQDRDVEIGLLHDTNGQDTNGQFATRMVEFAAAANGGGAVEQQQSASQELFKVELNKPYSASDGVLHTLLTHARPANLAHVMIEVNNKLIRHADGVESVANQLAALIALTLKSEQGQR